MVSVFFIKALVSVSIVVGLSVAAERLGPRIAGMLIGLPLGAGMVVAFTGHAQGTAFAAQAAVHMVPGFLSTLAFLHAYAQLAVRQPGGGWRALIVPGLAGHGAYAVAAVVMSQTSLPLEISVPLIAIGILISIRIMRSIPDRAILNRVTFGWGVLAFRAGMATAVILIITGLADRIGPQWTGILTAYPITLYPTVLVLHVAYSGPEVASVLKYVPRGLASVISFCVTVALTLQNLGLWWGLVAAYTVALSVLWGLSKLPSKKS